MAPTIGIFCFCSILLIALSESHLSLQSDTKVYDLLAEHGLPRGLIPNIVKSYSLSGDGSFRVELERPCYVQFELLVYYEKEITGKLTYGSVSDVSGIQAKKLFAWLPVTGIKANKDSGTVKFYVGFFSEEFPASQFDAVPSCKRQACKGQGSRLEAM